MERARGIRLRRLAVAAMGLTGTFILGVEAGARGSAPSLTRTCAAPDARIVVDLQSHTLVLCDKTRIVEIVGVRLGRGGIGKTREGDGKTPVGIYALGAPRASSRYGTFIPIGYPTQEQRRRGFTGGAVGIHGPARSVKWLGGLVNAFDLSDGCVGVARDAEMQRIADWVRSSSARTIELH